MYNVCHYRARYEEYNVQHYRVRYGGYNDMVAYERVMRSIILGHYMLHYSEHDGRADPDSKVRVKPIH